MPFLLQIVNLTNDLTNPMKPIYDLKKPAKPKKPMSDQNAINPTCNQKNPQMIQQI